MTITERFSLAGKTALITGASRGLGAAMARALAEAGADVALHASAEEPSNAALDIAHQCHVLAGCVTADLSKKDGAERLIADATAALGRIDILVNNAGIIRRSPAEIYSDADWDEVIQVNLTSVFHLCRAAGAAMLERGYGKIINIASLLAFQGGIRVAANAAAKGGVAQLTKSLANEWAGRGVNVNAIAPGFMRTENTKPLFEDPVRYSEITGRIPAGRWGEPADVAGAAVFLASPASDYVHGHVLVVDGGWMGR